MAISNCGEVAKTQSVSAFVPAGAEAPVARQEVGASTSLSAPVAVNPDKTIFGKAAVAVGSQQPMMAAFAVEAKKSNQVAATQAVKLEGLAGTTPFEKMKALFAEGVAAKTEDIIGKRLAGRMVKDDSPTKFYGALLIGEMALVGNGGPLFGDKVPRVGTLLSYTADQFDTVEGADLGLKDETPTYGYPTFPAATINGEGGSVEEFRVARGYVVERVSYKAEDKPHETYLYFFADVTAPKATPAGTKPAETKGKK